MSRITPKAGSEADMLLELEDARAQVEGGGVAALAIVMVMEDGSLGLCESFEVNTPAWLTLRGALTTVSGWVGVDGTLNVQKGLPPIPEERTEEQPEPPPAPVLPIGDRGSDG